MLSFGPLALLAYRLLRRGHGRSPRGNGGPSIWLRALGATVWASAHNLVGGSLALGILFALPVEVRDALYVRFPIILVLPLATGWLLHWLARRPSWSEAEPGHGVRHPWWAHVLTTLSVLIGAYPLVIWLGETWIAGWYPRAPTCRTGRCGWRCSSAVGPALSRRIPCSYGWSGGGRADRWRRGRLVGTEDAANMPQALPLSRERR